MVLHEAASWFPEAPGDVVLHKAAPWSPEAPGVLWFVEYDVSSSLPLSGRSQPRQKHQSKIKYTHTLDNPLWVIEG